MDNSVLYGSKRTNQIYTVLMALALICTLIGIFSTVYNYKVMYIYGIPFSYFFGDITDLTNQRSYVGFDLYNIYTSRMLWYFIDHRIFFYNLMLVFLIFGTLTISNCIKAINGYSNLKLIYPLFIFGSIILVLLYDSFMISSSFRCKFGTGPILLQLATGFILLGFIFNTVMMKNYYKSKKIIIAKIILKISLLIMIYILLTKMIYPNVNYTQIHNYRTNVDVSIFSCYIELVTYSTSNDDMIIYFISTIYINTYIFSFISLIIFFIFVVLDKEEYILFMLPFLLLSIIFSSNKLIELDCTFSESTVTSLLNSSYIMYGIAIILSVVDIVINQIIKREKSKFLYYNFDEVNY